MPSAVCFFQRNVVDACLSLVAASNHLDNKFNTMASEDSFSVCLPSNERAWPPTMRCMHVLNRSLFIT